MGFDWPSNGAGWRHESRGPLEFWHATARSRDELSRANRTVVYIKLASFRNTKGRCLTDRAKAAGASPAGTRRWSGREKGSLASQRNSSLLESARQLQA